MHETVAGVPRLCETLLMQFEAGRFLLRDFEAEDRAAFIDYQTDPRYRALYDIGPEQDERADALFDRFLAWQSATPRVNLQPVSYTHLTLPTKRIV